MEGEVGYSKINQLECSQKYLSLYFSLIRKHKSSLFENEI